MTHHSRLMPPLSERDFQQQVTELAHLYGWEDFHVRAGRTADSWRVPGSGTMAAGWPDLVLIRGRRLLFVELKTDAGKLTANQERVLDVLSGLTTPPPDGSTIVETWVWRPKDWESVRRALGDVEKERA